MTEALTGTWWVVRTSLPRWRRRTDPTITYDALPDGTVHETVRYRARGQDRTIDGIDSRLDDNHFEWRGTGRLTQWTTARWSILAHEEPWLFLLFDKTPFSPSGVDILWREPVPEDRAVVTLERRLYDLPAARAYRARLYAPTQSG